MQFVIYLSLLHVYLLTNWTMQYSLTRDVVPLYGVDLHVHQIEWYGSSI